MLFPNVCYLVQTVAQAVLSFTWFYAFYATFKIEAIFTFFVDLQSKSPAACVDTPFTVWGNTLFMNADSPNISHKTMTHFSVAELTFQKHRFLKLLLPCGSLQGLTFLQGACGKRRLCRGTCGLCQWNYQVQNNQILFGLFYSPISLPFCPSSVCVYFKKASGNNCYLKLRSINIADVLMFNYR